MSNHATDPPIDFMALALDEARAAAQSGEVPVGAVIVDATGRVIARAGNAMRRIQDPTAHAEMLAIRAAAAALGNERLSDCDLYVSLEPCAMCAGAIAHARLRRVYYAAADPKAGAVDNGVAYFDQASCHHKPDCYGGIRAQEAAEMLQSFFRSRR